MNAKKLLDFFSQSTIDNSAEINPLRAAEEEFFNRNGGMGYRQRAWDFVCEHLLSFSMTTNCHGQFQNILSVACPYCRDKAGSVYRKMDSCGGSSNSDAAHFPFRCPDCKAEISISVTAFYVHAQNIKGSPEFIEKENERKAKSKEV